MTTQNSTQGFLQQVFIVIVFFGFLYYGVQGYLATNTNSVQYDFEELADNNLGFLSIQEGNALVLSPSVLGNIYSYNLENMTFSDNIEKTTINYSSVDDYIVSYDLTFFQDGNYSAEEIRFDAGLLSSANVSDRLRFALSYLESDDAYRIDLDGEDLTFVEDYAQDSIDGLKVEYRVNEVTGFITATVYTKFEGDQTRVYENVAQISNEIGNDNLTISPESFWNSALIIGTENTSLIVEKLELTY